MTVEERVYNYPTKHKQGFVQSEILELLTNYPTINMKQFYNALTGNTCALIDNEVVNYHCDIELAIRCGLENRKPTAYEFD